LKLHELNQHSDFDLRRNSLGNYKDQSNNPALASDFAFAWLWSAS